MSEPAWLRRDVLELLHSESVAEHGGAEGLRDEGLFESALARPRGLFAYEHETDMLDMALAVEPNSRLSCQLICKPELDGIKVTIAPE